MLDIGNSLIKDVCGHQIALLNLGSSDVSYVPLPQVQKGPDSAVHSGRSAGREVKDRAYKRSLTDWRTVADQVNTPAHWMPCRAPARCDPCPVRATSGHDRPYLESRRCFRRGSENKPVKAPSTRFQTCHPREARLLPAGSQLSRKWRSERRLLPDAMHLGVHGNWPQHTPLCQPANVLFSPSSKAFHPRIKADGRRVAKPGGSHDHSRSHCVGRAVDRPRMATRHSRQCRLSTMSPRCSPISNAWMAGSPIRRISVFASFGPYRILRLRR